MQTIVTVLYRQQKHDNTGHTILPCAFQITVDLRRGYMREWLEFLGRTSLKRSQIRQI